MAEQTATPPATQQPPVGGAPPANEPDVAALNARIKALETSNDEAKFAASYWQQKAEAPPPAPRPQAKEQKADVDPLDVLAKEGTAGFKRLLAEEGYISKTDAEQLVNAKAAEIATSDMLKKQYPELDDPSSQFFKDTALELNNYVKLGYSRVEALKAAARDTELSHLKTGKRETPKQTEEREARAAAQSKADKGSRSADDEDYDSEELTPLQKKICAEMGVSEEAYIKRAKAGVMLSGPPPRPTAKGKR